MDLFDDMLRAETHFQGGTMGPGCVTPASRQLNVGGNRVTPHASNRDRKRRTMSPKQSLGSPTSSNSWASSSFRQPRPAKHTARFGNRLMATWGAETALSDSVVRSTSSQRPQTVPTQLQTRQPSNGSNNTTTTRRAPTPSQARTPPSLLVDPTTSATTGRKDPSQVLTTTQHQLASQQLQKAKAQSKQHAAPYLTFETTQQRKARLCAIKDSEARSFELNKRIYTGFVPTPMTTTATEHFAGCDQQLFRSLHGDWDDNRRVKGHFTEYLRQSIKKNINLKQTGHA